MKHQDLLKEMSDSIGVQEPVVYFDKLTQLLGMLFDRLDTLETKLALAHRFAAMAIQWDAKLASNMLAEAIDSLEESDRDAYAVEIRTLRQAYVEDRITQEHASFCQFWQEVLGYHPFMDYE